MRKSRDPARKAILPSSRSRTVVTATCVGCGLAHNPNISGEWDWCDECLPGRIADVIAELDGAA